MTRAAAAGCAQGCSMPLPRRHRRAGAFRIVPPGAWKVTMVITEITIAPKGTGAIEFELT